MPEGRGTVVLKLGPDVLAWFQSRGEGYQARINSVLRDYVATHSD